MTVVNIPAPPPSAYNGKDSPEFRLRVWPTSAIARRTRDSFGIQDTFNALVIHANERDSADTDQEDGVTDRRVGSDLVIGSQLQWVTFDKERAYYGLREALQHQDALTFLTLRHIDVWQNARVVGDTGAPEGDPGTSLRWWKPLKGSAWRTVRADRSPWVTGFYHALQTPDADVGIQTEKPLPANQGFRLDLAPLQIAQTQTKKARIRIAWGGTFSVVLRQDASPTLERRGAGGPWKVWREMTALGTPSLEKGKNIILRVFREAGRLIVWMNDDIVAVMDTKTVDTQKDTEEPVDVGWKAAPLALTFYGITTRIEFALLDWSHIWKRLLAKPSAELDILLFRRLSRDGAGPLDLDSALTFMGWQPPGSKIGLVFSGSLEQKSPPATAKEGSQDIIYACGLLPNKRGRESPAVSGVMGYFKAEHSTGEGDLLDLSTAVSSASESTAEPGTNSSSEITCELSGAILDRQFPGWRDLLRSGGYNPVEFAVRWRLRDGSYTPWVVRLSGYLWQMTQHMDVVNGEKVSLVLRDPILRLTQPSGIITDKHPAMSVLIQNNPGRAVYGADVIQEIIRVELGDIEAARMNGNGNARRFLPQDYPPLIGGSGNNDPVGLLNFNKPPTSGEIPLRPPYFHDAISWIKDTAKDDAGGQDTMVFFYGFVTDQENGGVNAGGTGETDEWPQFIYGAIGPILSGRTRWEMADAVYVAGDQDMLLDEMELQTAPEKDINTWIVTNTPTDTGKSSPFPAMYMATDRLPPDDPRAPGKTWERTAVFEQKAQWYDQEWCNRMAALLVTDNAGNPVRMPRFKFPRGEPKMQWGDLVRVKSLRVQLGGQDGEFALELNEWFRVLRLDNHYENDGSDAPSFTSDVVCRVLSNSEKESLGLT